jgi:hypothetical protein
MNDLCVSRPGLQLWRSLPASFRRRKTLGGGDFEREERADVGEDLGVAEQALSQTNTVVAIPNTTVNNFTEVSATWIKGTSLTNSEVAGTGFVAINAAPSGGSYIVTSLSTNVLATTPTWTALADSTSSNSPTKWPAPENLCDWYPNQSNCGGSGGSWQPGMTNASTSPSVSLQTRAARAVPLGTPRTQRPTPRAPSRGG